jgi:hypothetical protein
MKRRQFLKHIGATSLAAPERIIEIGLKEALRSPEGYCQLGEVEVQSP